ncbi:MAG TPA: LamG-like jellyroll fold domain-containing protein, partial [Candidatus Limnocylindrales bacterium]
MARRLALSIASLLGATLLTVGIVPATFAQDPTVRGGHILGKDAAIADAPLAATLPSGFQDSVVFSGLTNPSNVQFSPDGRVFVAEKSGLIKVFASLTATSPTIFADLRTQVDNYWDRGLLGLALPPDFPANPYVYVLYTYDAPIGGAAPVWNDACPTPPGPTTDGCVVSARVSRLQASGSVMTGPEQVLINDWCQQFPSHSIGTVGFGPDGALYVGAGDGASFNGVDYGQLGGSAGSPTPKNPCGDPPAGVGGSESPPAAEGGALRSQDVRTLATGGATYRSVVLADNPISYWRLGETSGTVATDERGLNPGSYGTGATLGSPGALSGDANTAVDVAGLSGQRPVVVPHTSTLDIGNGPFSIEAWARRDTTGTLDTILDYGYGATGGGPALEYVGDRIGLWRNGAGNIVQETGTTTDGAWHHIVATWNGTTALLYKDGALVSGPTTSRILSNQTGPLLIGANLDAGEEFDGKLDEVAIYSTVLSPSQVAAHYSAAAGTGGQGDPTGLDGAILRLDPTTGAAMPGNPLISSSDLNARRIIAHGFRNPFRWTFRPGTSELWVGDVGFSDWEEIDLLANPTGGLANYGWPCYEGTGRQPSYDATDLTLCESLYAGGGATSPYYTYNHAAQVVPGETCPTANGSSIAGLAFYQGGGYPTSYNGGLFFADYSRDCIWFMPALGSGRPDISRISTFVAGASNPVDLKIGPGGDLFYVDFDLGAIHRVRYTAGNQPPTAVIAANPTSGSAPLSVTFDGSGSTDPEGSTLTYAWDFDGNGTDDATGVQASHTYSATGSYLARLRVTDSGGLSDSRTVTISVNSNPPVPVIQSPSSSFTWAVGTTISFSGSATDPEDGQLPASALSWTVNLHHCPTDPNSCHIHVIQTFSGVASGSFAAPDHEYPSWLELVLTATDSTNLSASTAVRLDPQTVQLAFNSVPSGLQLTVGSTSSTTPFNRTVIRGSRNSLGAPSPQDAGGDRYAWSSWSDGLAQAHDVVATGSASYTAAYQPISADMRISQAAVVSGSQVTIDLTATNGGPAAASGVIVTDPLPAKFTFQSASSSVGTCSYRPTDRTVVCSATSLSSGQAAAITIHVTSKKGTFSNTATVSATSPDLN